MPNSKDVLLHAFTRERRALGISALAGVLLGLAGIVLGLVSATQVVLFDGFYTFLGVALSWMALRASYLVSLGPTSKYPFGREALSPLIVGVEGVALLATCAYAVFEATLTFLHGGTSVPPIWATVYAAFAFVLPLITWWSLRRIAATSQMVRAEATQWLAGAGLGASMLLAFYFAHVVQGTSWAVIGPYVDPSLVILASLAFVYPPVRLIRTTLRELVEARPGLDLSTAVTDAVERTSQEGLINHRLRTTKVGTKLYVELDYTVSPDWTVRQSDTLRALLHSALSSLPYDLWLTVEFTANPQGT
jgi:predicted Co/Zn/Cd cation transporter (cation efflux family)